MNLKNKTLALVVASALVMPSALAVEGSDGMHYTSAGEGFYTSIRVNFHSGKTDGDNAGLGNQSSRLGVRGTSEMSHGLEGFYVYEAGFDIDNGSGISTRMGHVGLRGGFGSIAVGTNWTDEYNFAVGVTDIANVGGGNFAYSDSYGGGRSSNSIFYKSPDFNGLQVAVRFEVDGGNDGSGFKNVADAQAEVDGIVAAGGTAEELEKAVEEALTAHDSELDAWALSAKYAFSGFTVGGTYLTRPDYQYGLSIDNNLALNVEPIEDLTAWALRGSYGQDNWGVSTWYGENNASDFGSTKDETVFSISGDVNVGPSRVYVIHETMEDGAGDEDAYTTFGVEYNFNSKAKTWIEYNAQDAETDDSKEDFVSIGLRHDF